VDRVRGRGRSSVPAPVDDGSWLDDGWSLGAAALLGVAAYEGVRRLLARHGAAAASGSDNTVPAAPAIQAADLAHSSAARPPESRTASAPPSAFETDLVDDLITLHDLAPTDAMRRRVVKTLAKAGVDPIAADGARFDERLHDALDTVPADASTPPGTVVEVLRPGFADQDGRVVRAAQVVVATNQDGAW
jgi:hypothetical protein